MSSASSTDNRNAPSLPEPQIVQHDDACRGAVKDKANGGQVRRVEGRAGPACGGERTPCELDRAVRVAQRRRNGVALAARDRAVERSAPEVRLMGADRTRGGGGLLVRAERRGVVVGRPVAGVAGRGPGAPVLYSQS